MSENSTDAEAVLVWMKDGGTRMQYKKKVRRMLAAAVVISAWLSGCGITAVSMEKAEVPLQHLGVWFDVRAVWEDLYAQLGVVEQEKEQEAEPPSVVIPELSARGEQLSDFVPEDWELMDSVELDFNQDKLADYVGVLQTVRQEASEDYWEYPRILFAVASDGNQGYRLSFQDMNLIRTRYEGGTFGDPYLPLTAENTSFTTHSYGGSAWRWGEDYTYTYIEGTWYLTQSETFSGYGGYITSYEYNDWETGVGIRERRSDDFDDMEAHWEDEEPDFDIVYELSLDEPPTLSQAGKRWWLAPDRPMDFAVKSIVIAEGITLSEDMVKLPADVGWFDYNDEECMLYTFQNESTQKYYLAMYHPQDKVLSVLVESSERGVFIDDLEYYQGKIYYTTKIIENIAYKKTKNGVESIAHTDSTVGLTLHRMNADGTEKEALFEYRYPGAEQEISEYEMPYMSLVYEISGGEIVVEVYIGQGTPHPFYRMNG